MACAWGLDFELWRRPRHVASSSAKCSLADVVLDACVSDEISQFMADCREKSERGGFPCDYNTDKYPRGLSEAEIETITEEFDRLTWRQ